MLSLNQERWSQFISCIQYRHEIGTVAEHPFLNRLDCVLKDENSTGLDLAYAIRDVLACIYALQQKGEHLSGDLCFFDSRLNSDICNQVGIAQQVSNGIFRLVQPIVEENINVYLKKARRNIRALPLDPILKPVLNPSGIDHYNGEGQRQAIRTILSSPDNSTIFIQLPTGCGKTLAIHALSLMEQHRGLIVVIIPTVGLGIEQAQRAKEILAKANLDHGGSYVWHGQTTEEERKNIRDRMNSGAQRILFCSPEVAISSLRSQLFDLATKGLINSIFVDEAHLIDSWGVEFRPEFQLLPALIRSLKKYAINSGCGIRSILMSATFSQSTWDLLKKLFKDPSPFLSVNGSFLRPEIQFQIKKAADQTDHEHLVLQCLHNLPRPVILYSIKRDDAKFWFEKLKTLGFNRIGLFHGETTIADREQLIQSWQKNQIEIMVATSAFGVGMDKSDVHSVLHAAVPENMDRFYQEAGRGGRDGAACLSWLIYHDEQFNVAEKMSQSKLISVEIGFERWESMCQNHGALHDGKMSITLSNFRHSITRKSDENLAWNIRTLLLMQRAGIIELHYMPLEGIPEGVSDEEKQKQYTAYQDLIYIKVLNDNHRDKTIWEKLVAERRSIEKKERQVQFTQLKAWLKVPDEPLCFKMQRFYTLDEHQPEYSCGGCPGCRAENRHIFTPTLGCYAYQSHIKDDILFPDVNYVYYAENKPISAQFRRLYVQEWQTWIVLLIQQKKVGAIRASKETLDILHHLPKMPFWVGIEFSEPSIGVNELVLVFPTESWPTYTFTTNAPAQIIVAPENLPDSRYPHRLWWETIAHSQRLNDFLNRGK